MTYAKLNRQRQINLANQAKAQLATTKREAAGDAPSSQRHKQFDVDDPDHPLNAWFLSNFDERVEMLNTNNDIWGLLCAGSGHLKEEMQILHLPTTVKNAKGDNIIRGYIGTSLHWKQEVEFSTNYLLDMVTTAPLLQVQDEHLLLTPPNITRNKTAITETKGQEWVPTRCPVAIPLVGNNCSGQIKEDQASNLDMVKAYHPLAWYWLNAARGFNANDSEDVNVLADCKDYQDVLRIKEHLLFESPKIYLKLTPNEEKHAACMKQARARRREMRAANQKHF